MKRIVTIAVIVVIVIVAATVLTMQRRPDLSKYEGLKRPRIVEMNDQRMLVVEVKGDPNVAGQKAFSLLLRTYYRMKATPKGAKAPAPRSRWPLSFTTPKSEWLGFYGMPVPDGVTTLPSYKAEPGLKMELTTWEYGQVGEILHVGPYDKETPSVDNLMQFIKEQGYEVTGPHEEEYLKGPGMFFRGNPERYYTIIRYRVTKAGGLGAVDTTR